MVDLNSNEDEIIKQVKQDWIEEKTEEPEHCDNCNKLTKVFYSSYSYEGECDSSLCLECRIKELKEADEFDKYLESLPNCESCGIPMVPKNNKEGLCKSCWKSKTQCGKCHRGSKGGFKIWQVLDNTCVEVGPDDNICDRCCCICSWDLECTVKKMEI